MKHASWILVGVGCLLLSGCGHSIAHIDRGTGIDLSLPMPYSGEDLVSLKIGQIDSTSFIFRGNVSFTTESGTKGEIGAKTGNATSGEASGGGAISQKITFSSGPQLNEGYLRDVLIDPNATLELKQAVIEYLKSGAPKAAK